MSRRYIAGLAAQNTQYAINLNKNMENKTKNAESDDITNRRYVRGKIIEYLRSGMEKKDVVEKILNDPIMKKFDYLSKNGLNIETCVNEWVENAAKNSQNKGGKTR